MLAIDYSKDPRYQVLDKAAVELQAGRPEKAKQLLSSLPRLHPGKDSTDLKYFIFMRALWKRFDQQLIHPGNLYMTKFASLQIDLFNLLASKLPLITKAGFAGNEFLASKLTEQDHPTLIDIGIGTGRQVTALLRRLRGHLKKVRIVGIEPSAECLTQAVKAIEETAREVNIEAEFFPVNTGIESLSRDEWRSIHAVGKNPVLNEAFALHHVANQSSTRTPGHDLKDDVLAKLADLEPSTFLMTEPHSDHQSPNLSERFRNAWHHFGLVFDVIDLIDASPTDREAVKVLFFAREIEDILGGAEAERFERHEPAQMWIGRLQRAGFKIDHSLGSFRDPEHNRRGGVQLNWHREYLGLEYQNETIVSLIASKA